MREIASNHKPLKPPQTVSNRGGGPQSEGEHAPEPFPLLPPPVRAALCDRDRVRAAYQGRTQKQAGELLGVSADTFRRALVMHRIPTRGRGDVVGQHRDKVKLAAYRAYRRSGR